MQSFIDFKRKKDHGGNERQYDSLENLKRFTPISQRHEALEQSSSEMLDEGHQRKEALITEMTDDKKD